MVGCDLARMALVAGIAVPAGPFWALCTLLVAAELLSAPFGAARAAAAARGAPGRPVRRRQCRQQRHHPGRPGARLRRRRRAGGRARHLGHLGPRRGDVRGVRRVALARATAPTRAAGSGDRYQVGLAAALGGEPDLIPVTGPGALGCWARWPCWRIRPGSVARCTL